MKKSMVPLFLFALLAIACGPTYQITSDYEKEVDFSSYQTYKILQHQKDFQLGINPINQQRIERALNKEMTNLGYQPSESPNLLVAYFVKIERVKEVNNYYGPYYQRWAAPYWAKVNEYEEGTLVVDMIDIEKNQVVWHGAVSGRIDRDINDVEEKINQVVKEMIATYAKETGTSKKEMVNL